MIAWAWLGWITITFLLAVSLFYAISTRRWKSQIPHAWELIHRSTPDFTIDGDERAGASKMEQGNDVLRPSAGKGGIDLNNYEFERSKRAVDWLQENPQIFGRGRVEGPGPSTLA